MRKLASEVCLLEQSFVKNPDLNVKVMWLRFLKSTGSEIEIIGFHTLNLGEGVEKKVDNLADEVAKMTQQQ